MNLLTGLPGRSGPGRLMWRSQAWTQQAPAGIQSKPWLQSTAQTEQPSAAGDHWSTPDLYSPVELDFFSMSPPPDRVVAGWSINGPAPPPPPQQQQRQPARSGADSVSSRISCRSTASQGGAIVMDSSINRLVNSGREPDEDLSASTTYVTYRLSYKAASMHTCLQVHFCM